jgi:AcrR family transcriptional regulator
MRGASGEVAQDDRSVSADTGSRILEHADRLFESEGVGGIVVRRIAKDLDITPTALYRHFASREELISRVIDRKLEDLAHRLSSAWTAPTPYERLRRSGIAYMEFALSHPKTFELLAIDPDDLRVPALREQCHRAMTAAFRSFEDRVRECVADGSLRGGVAETALLVWSSAQGLLNLYVAGHIDADDESFREMYVACGRRLYLLLSQDRPT